MQNRFARRGRSAGAYLYLVLILVLVLLAIPHRTRSQTSTSTGASTVPQRILYFQLFNHVVYLDHQAGVANQQGQNGAVLSNYYQVHAGLNDAETALLKSTAHDAITAVEAVDQQAQAVIAAYRAQFPIAGWSRKTPLPPPPPELHTLQVARDNITLSHLSSLQSGFGSDFQRFDSYVQSALGPHITVTTAATPTAAGGAVPPALPVPWK